MTFQKHPLALVDGDDVGERTRVWAWAHVMAGARVGADCNIGEHCFVEDGAVVGDRVTLKNGVAVWEGVRVESDVFIGPYAVLTNDKRPRSRKPGFVAESTNLLRGCTVGANATILPGVTVGRYAFVGAASLITRDVPPHALVTGRPARVRGYVCFCAETLEFSGSEAACRCGKQFLLGPGGVQPLG